MTSGPQPSRGHTELAARVRARGWWHVAGVRMRRERPFLGTFLVTALGNPVLYLAAMGVGLGALISQPLDGVGYAQFVAPGLLVSTVVTSAAGWGTWPILSGFKWEKHYLAAAASPVSPAQIAVGETAALSARLLAQGAAFWVLGFGFGVWESGWSWAMIPIATLAGLAMFAPLMAYAATVVDEGLQFNMIQRFVVMPMFLFAGTFFPLDSMPPYLQWVGWVSPMWHGTQLARVASYGMALDPLAAVGHVAFLVVLAVAGLILARRTFTRRLIA